jgi:ATP-dependent RNA helicase DeaD
MTTFKELGLNSEILKGLDDLKFIEPSPVQAKVIPFILKSKKDVIALAQTGTGKTAAFGLPILNQIKPQERDLQAIILCPTRELCIQISRDMKKYARYLKGIDVTPVYGGEGIHIQIKALRKGTNIVVGTPGRVHDLIRRGVLRLNSIKWVVLDEADEMLDMGFKDDLDGILGETPKERRTLLFSATISRSIHSIAKNYMNEAEELSVGERNAGADNVSHEYYVAYSRDRFDVLKRILDYLPGVYGILFCRTRNETQEVADKLKRANYDAEALHGDISQNMRTKIMDRFKRRETALLVATDVAARGIDVNNLSHVINYNLPDQSKSYTHRSGRTGRAQQSGVAISIVTPSEARRVQEMERMVGKRIEYKKIPNGKDVYLKQIDNFIEEIENTDIKKIGNESYYSEIATKLKKIKKEDLIKHFITHKFGNLINSSQVNRDLNANAKATTHGGGSGRSRSSFSAGENEVNLEINFGKKNKFNIKELFGLINFNKKLRGIKIGRIDLYPEYSVFSVDKKRADEAVNCLTGAKFRGQKIIIRKSAQSANYSKRYSGAGGGYKGNKRGPRRGRQ